MTLVQLRQFAVLARVGSFVKAAAQLHMTQPALSRSIKALEQELGQLLFDRVGRAIELTVFGRDTLARVQLLLEDAAQLKSSGQALHKYTTGRVRLGLSSGPGAMLTLPILRHFARHFPNLQIDITRANTATLAHMLRQRELDAAIVDIRSLTPAPDLAVSAHAAMRGTFLCRKNHPLARKARLGFQHLSDYPIASTPLSDEVSRLLVERYGEAAHPQRMVRYTSDELAYLVELARHSDTVLLAIRSVAPDLVELKVQPALHADARFGLVTLRSRTEAAYLPEIRRLMGEILQ